MQPITIHNSQPIGAEINSADARELHSFLNSERQYANWIQDRITQYGFIENQENYLHRQTSTQRVFCYSRYGKRALYGRKQRQGQRSETVFY